MNQQVIVARSPDRKKVTTISIRLGEQGVPFGWEYIFCDREEIPKGSLNKIWGLLSTGKVIYTSTNGHRSFLEISQAYRGAEEHLSNLHNRRNEKLEELDIEFIRTFERAPKSQKNTKKREAIVRLKDDLRSMDPKIEDFKTISEAISYEPPVLKRGIDDYITKSFHWGIYLFMSLLCLGIIIMAVLLFL